MTPFHVLELTLPGPPRRASSSAPGGQASADRERGPYPADDGAERAAWAAAAGCVQPVRCWQPCPA